MIIEEIIFSNYRAFCNLPGEENSRYKISLVGFKNLLVYGENGSGKSSLFKGLKDFFFSASDNRHQFSRNIFSQDFALSDEPFIKVVFKDGENRQEFYFSSDFARINTGTELLRSAHKSRSFMSYRELMKIHFIDDTNVNLFDFLFGGSGILSEITNPVSSVPETKVSLGLLWRMLREKPDDVLLNDFNLGLRQLLNELTRYLNLLLKYFDSRTEATLVFTNLTIQNAREGKCWIGLTVKYCQREIDEYHLFLNEARLTALAISLYLGAHLTVPKEAYEILFLDDVFTGLDTSNRIPLLKIISDPIIQGTQGDTFRGHQIFLTTYDRHWFNLARLRLGTDWKAIELFIEDAEIIRPILNDPSLDYLGKAKMYFEKRDYPACANYQRKECERIIKQFLPDNLKYTPADGGEIAPIKMLGQLFANLRKYFTDNGMDFADFSNFSNYARIVLNPLSHDDLESPAYQREILEVFELIAKLRKLKSTSILEPGTVIYLSKIHGTTAVVHDYEFELKSHIRLLEYDQIRMYTKVTLNPIRVVVQNTPPQTSRLSFEGQIDSVYNRICNALQIQHGDKMNEFFIKVAGVRQNLGAIVS